MNFEQLKIFISVAENKSFTKAAELLYISHSTTSRNVAALEAELGVCLLSRDNRSVRLTPAGEILFREGAKLVKKVEDVENSVRNAGLGRTGKLNVAVISMTLAGVIKGGQDFCRKYPDVLLGVYSCSAAEVRAQVESGDADVGITFSYGLPEDMSPYKFKEIARERFCLVVPADSRILAAEAVTLPEVAELGAAVIVEESFLSAQVREKLLEPVGEAGRCVMPTPESLFMQVRAGNGVAIVPRSVAEEYGALCRIVEIKDKEAEFDVVIFWRRDDMNPSLPLFVEAVVSGAENREGEK